MPCKASCAVSHLEPLISHYNVLLWLLLSPKEMKSLDGSHVASSRISVYLSWKPLGVGKDTGAGF